MNHFVDPEAKKTSSLALMDMYMANMGEHYWEIWLQSYAPMMRLQDTHLIPYPPTFTILDGETES